MALATMNAVFGMLRRVAVIRTDVSEERPFLQHPRSVTFQKTAFFS
jgi:hypothetical protein